MHGKGFVFVYSIISKQSFEELKALRSRLYQVRDIPEQTELPLVICGNKVDLEAERQVSRQEGESLSQQWKCGFFETSAKTSVNVKEAFMDLVERIDKLDAQSGSSKKKKSKCTLL